MAIGKPLSSAAVSEARPWRELDRVTLLVARTEERGTRRLPAGADGTVVAVIKGGEAYIVEFTRPIQALATVEPTDIAPFEPALA